MNTKAFGRQKLVKFYQLKENCVKEEDEIVGHLPLGKDGKFAKAVFYFLRVDEYCFCNVLMNGNPINLGDADEMQVSCTLNFIGRKKLICILQKTLKF